MTKNIILTALDNNQRAWYDLLVPFLVSLKNTQYKGDIGVISYGLAEEKIALLKQHGILVFPATRQSTDLSVDRYLSVNSILQATDYDKAALYDADIWFPEPTFDVFAEFTHPEKLYASADIWNCNYVYYPAKEYGIERLREKMQYVMKTYGYTIQAGLVAGTRLAWQRYSEFISKTLYGDQFTLMYGIDTTLLNLYAAENELTLLNKKFNCIPRWGYRQEESGAFTTDGEVVCGLHLTGDSRYIKNLSYKYRHEALYLEQGQRYDPLHRSMQSIDAGTLVNSPTNTINESGQARTRLPLVSAASSHHLSIKRDTAGIFFSSNDLLIKVQGDSDIIIKAQTKAEFSILFSHVPSFQLPLAASVYINDARYDIQDNMVYGLPLAPNDTLRLSTRNLWQENAHLTWVLANTELCSQA